MQFVRYVKMQEMQKNIKHVRNLDHNLWCGGVVSSAFKPKYSTGVIVSGVILQNNINNYVMKCWTIFIIITW